MVWASIVTESAGPGMTPVGALTQVLPSAEICHEVLEPQLPVCALRNCVCSNCTAVTTSESSDTWVPQISPAVAQARQAGNNGPNLVEAATDIHLKGLEETLFRVSPIIRGAIDAGRLEVVVAKYFLHAGQVQPLTSTF